MELSSTVFAQCKARTWLQLLALPKRKQFWFKVFKIYLFYQLKGSTTNYSTYLCQECIESHMIKYLFQPLLFFFKKAQNEARKIGVLTAQVLTGNFLSPCLVSLQFNPRTLLQSSYLIRQKIFPTKNISLASLIMSSEEMDLDCISTKLSQVLLKKYCSSVDLKTVIFWLA